MVEIDKNWCLAAAEREDGQEVGVGFELGPVVELRLKITALEKEVERLTTEGARKDDVISHLDNELERRDAQVKIVLEWCNENIAGKTQVTPFCVQVRDLLEREPVSGRRSSNNG